eukprot:GHVQ01022339.1.p1 GENE.GHVQ01022339.1~~GHVQ01022339.1.p1  ORF type:complete len:164 (+),score=13.39 GHVQ01022339.1:397-888(+)
MTLINKTVKEWLLVVVLALLWSVLCLSPFMAAAADETSPQNTDSVADGHPAVSVSRAERSKYCLGRSLFLLGVFAFGSFIAFIASKYLVGSLDTAIIESPFTDSVYRVTDKLGIFAIVALTTSLIRKVCNSYTCMYSWGCGCCRTQCRAYKDLSRRELCVDSM